jgi:C1A family cysteine protease
VSGYVGGYRADLERRDELLQLALPANAMAAALAMTFTRPREIDPRKRSIVRNQLQEGSCQGHAVAAAAEVCYLAATGETIQFSPDWAYYQSQAHDGIHGDHGSTISGGLWMAKQIGNLPEKHMPYSPRYNPGDMPRDGKRIAAEFVVRTGALLATFEQVVDWLARGYGGVWYGALWDVEPDAQGFIRRWRTGRGGHANALLGYGAEVDSDGYPSWLWNKNSWGTSWGLGGWAKLTREGFAGMIAAGGIVAGISDMDQLQPRTVDWEKSSVFA